MIGYVIGLWNNEDTIYYTEKDGVGVMTPNLASALVFKKDAMKRLKLKEGLSWLPVFIPTED